MSEVLWNNLPDFPDNRHDLKNGSCLTAQKDLSVLWIVEGGSIPLVWDGKYVKCGPLSWSVKQICDEIDNWIWEVMDDQSAAQCIEAIRERVNTKLQ